MRRSLVRSALGLAALLAVVAPAVAGEALPRPPHTAQLVFTRGAGTDACPDEATLRAAVVSRLGYDPVQADAPQTVTASIHHRGATLQGELELRDAQGTIGGARTVVAAENDCAELVASMAIAISIAIDPQSELRPPPPAPPAPVEAPHAPAASIAAPPAPPAPKRPPRAPPRVRIGAGVAVGAGAEPHVSVGVTGHLGVRWPWFSLDLEGRGDFAASMRADAGGSVSASLFTGAIVPCFHWRVLAVCGVTAAGALRGEGAQVTTPKTDVTPFVSFGARLGVEIPITRVLAAAVYGEGAVPIVRATLRLNEQDVWRAPPITGALGAGLVASFP